MSSFVVAPPPEMAPTPSQRRPSPGASSTLYGPAGGGGGGLGGEGVPALLAPTQPLCGLPKAIVSPIQQVLTGWAGPATEGASRGGQCQSVMQMSNSREGVGTNAVARRNILLFAAVRGSPANCHTTHFASAQQA